jgi:hypothetical protein
MNGSLVLMGMEKNLSQSNYGLTCNPWFMVFYQLCQQNLKDFLILLSNLLLLIKIALKITFAKSGHAMAKTTTQLGDSKRTHRILFDMDRQQSAEKAMQEQVGKRKPAPSLCSYL